MGNDEAEAMKKLAQAMDKLADRLEKFQDPVLWQKLLDDAVLTLPGLQQGMLPQPIVAEAVQLPHRIVGITISLSDEERAKLVTQVYEAVQPQIAEFGEFLKQSLHELPAYRLKAIADKIATGEKPAIKRRHGCVFIEVGDIAIYLGL